MCLHWPGTTCSLDQTLVWFWPSALGFVQLRYTSRTWPATRVCCAETHLGVQNELVRGVLPGGCQLSCDQANGPVSYRCGIQKHVSAYWFFQHYIFVYVQCDRPRVTRHSFGRLSGWDTRSCVSLGRLVARLNKSTATTCSPTLLQAPNSCREANLTRYVPADHCLRYMLSIRAVLWQFLLTFWKPGLLRNTSEGFSRKMFKPSTEFREGLVSEHSAFSFALPSTVTALSAFIYDFVSLHSCN
jgi:hypothetical protein